jgi:bifunctional DNA-binding transcriptional regulator/antitoxin component of YhaV-PrlF toxin-antitoxin module
MSYLLLKSVLYIHSETNFSCLVFVDMLILDMGVITIPKPLRDKLGDEATDSLVDILDRLEQSSQRGLATKEDIHTIELKIARIESDIRLIKWMLGIIIAGILSLILKAFF